MSESQIITRDFYGQQITLLCAGEDTFALFDQLCVHMGIDTNGQRQLLERQVWSQSMTCVTHVMLPGERRSYPRFVINVKILGMWLANITTSRIQDEHARHMVERFQVELTSKIHEWLTGASPAATGREIPQDFASALREFAAEIEAHDATRAALAVATPRAEAWDAIVSAEGDYSVGDAAKILARAGVQTGPQRLFNQLVQLGWTFRGSDGRPRAYADRVERGFLFERPTFHYHPGTGERVVDAPQIRVTVKGIEQLQRRLHAGGPKAVRA